jgi:glycosyltransferase involved in cell wall biosynthesis
MPPDVYVLPEISRPPRVLWCGDFFNYHSLALVNRELCRHLLEFECELSGEPLNPPDFSVDEDPARLDALARCSQASLSGPPDVMIHHGWPEPKFRPPGVPTWIVIQPWEYGFVPRIWVEGFTALADEIWGPSHYVRQCYIDSGVPPEKVVVIPNGVDTERFRPDVPPLPLQTDKSFKFLFVGGTIWRKGIDLLLKAYLLAFRANDDVCLVLKDVGAQTLYQDNQTRRLLDALRSSPHCAEVLELEGFLPDAQIPALYTACDCLVHPYRGEGFGLPIAEAMASGRPVIVTAGGASDDFCTDETAIRVESRIHEGVPRDFDAYEPIREPWVLEPDTKQLAAWMRHVYEHREEAQALGQAARAHIRAHFTWRHAAEKAYARLCQRVTRNPGFRGRVEMMNIETWSNGVMERWSDGVME